MFKTVVICFNNRTNFIYFNKSKQQYLSKFREPAYILFKNAVIITIPNCS